MEWSYYQVVFVVELNCNDNKILF